MRAFKLGEKFGLAIIPGHSFQYLNTPQDQLAALVCIRKHLSPGGTLVVHLDHQDVRWLGDLLGDAGGVYKPAERLRLGGDRRRRTGHRSLGDAANSLALRIPFRDGAPAPARRVCGRGSLRGLRPRITGGPEHRHDLGGAAGLKGGCPGPTRPWACVPRLSVIDSVHPQ